MALLATSCALDYVPARSQPVAVGSSTVEATHLSLGLSESIEVELSIGGSPLTVAAVRLAKPGESACGAGLPTLELESSQLGSASGVTVTIPARSFPANEARLDLLVVPAGEGPTCVSLPLFTWRPEDAWIHDDTIAFIERAEYLWYSTPVRGLEDQFVMSVGIGRWYDDVLIAGHVGMGGSVCPRHLCPPVIAAIDGQPTSSPSLAAGPVATIDASIWPLQYGYLSSGIAGRYSLFAGSMQTYDGDMAVWVHGPRVAPKIGIGEKPYLAPGLPGEARSAVIELEAPVGFVVSETGEFAAVYGLGLRIAVTVW